MRLFVVVLVGLAIAGSAGAAVHRPLQTGFLDPTAFDGPKGATSVARARSAGATIVRLVLYWNSVAPTRPADPANPNDGAYQWTDIDRQVMESVRGGLEPVICITNAPKWARGPAVGLPGNWPSPTRFGAFARTAARRYSGTFTPAGARRPLPAVHLWEAWNEPNADSDLEPQRIDGRPATPGQYRKMVNAFAAGVRGVDAKNQVIAGTLGPFGHDSNGIQVVAPMTFMADLLCVSAQPPYGKTCGQQTHFQIWAHNPYSNGGPDWTAYSQPDVSIGDLPRMRQLLVAAKRAGNIVSPGTPKFWVTEFSWDSNPPDPEGVPLALDARWVSEGLYRMWSAGVSAVIWHLLQDQPLRTSPYQSGFFTVAGRAKSTLEAFRFPFVAFTQGSGVTIWGRTPPGRSRSVAVEAQVGGRWIRVARTTADQYGIFSKVLQVPAGSTELRAQVGSETSIPFSLTVPPSRAIAPFGCGGPIPCSKGSGGVRDSRRVGYGGPASPNGVPSESRQIAQCSPGWTISPPSSRTRSRAAVRSVTGK